MVQKRIFCMMLAISLFLTACTAPQASASQSTVQQVQTAQLTQEENRTTFAFGLFSLVLPGELKDETLSMTMESAVTQTISAYINYAPLESYQNEAESNFNALISKVYAFQGDTENYEEGEILEKTREDGVSFRWQICGAKGNQFIWFEAFTENFGYNFVSMASECDEQTLLGIMDSFAYDETLEENYINFNQVRTKDDSVISIDHAFSIQLSDEWIPGQAQACVSPYVFVMERNQAQQLIQIARSPLMGNEITESQLIETYFEPIKTGAQQENIINDVKTMPLKELGINAFVMEFKVPSQGDYIHVFGVAFCYQNYLYWGQFSYMESTDSAQMLQDALACIAKP